MKRFLLSTAMSALAISVGAAPVPRVTEPSVRRVFREARHTRGNTNIVKVQPVDQASWIWSPDDGAFVKFRKCFSANPDARKLLIDVSADERFYLTLDGEFVARGPNRAIVENWQYQTYEIDLAEGEHVLEATVWRIGGSGPLAQLSFRGGFVLKADGDYDKSLTTGKAVWEVGILDGMRAIGMRAEECQTPTIQCNDTVATIFC